MLVTELDGDLTLYDPARNEVHTLNSTASDIWWLLDGEHSLDDIVALVAAAHGADPDSIRPHVASTVSTFVERGLLSAPAGG